jgi:CheY-like chemotaxis protein
MSSIDWPASILIVDDSVVARLGAKNVLTQLGSSSTIVEAAASDTGFEKWRESRADLAIVDFNMRGDDGLVLCAKLRDEDPDIRLILCTANIQRAVAERAAAMNVCMINKPLTASKLEPMIQKRCV